MFVLVATCQQADENQLVRRWTLGLDMIDSAHGEPACCPGNGLDYVRWIHAPGGRELAGDVLRLF